MTLALVDTSILIPGLLREARDGQQDQIPKAVEFFEWLDRNKVTTAIAAISVTELLLGAPLAAHASILGAIMRRFQVFAFDPAAAAACARLHHERQGEGLLDEIRRNPGSSKAKVRADCQIVAIGMARRVNVIYSIDPDVGRISGTQVQVAGFPAEIQGQTRLAFDPTAPH